MLLLIEWQQEQIMWFLAKLEQKSKQKTNLRVTDFWKLHFWKLYHACSVTSVMSDSATLWTVAHRLLCPLDSLSIGELPYPTPVGRSDSEIEPVAPETLALQADSLPSEPPGKPRVHHIIQILSHKKKKLQNLHQVITNKATVNRNLKCKC